LLGGKYGDDFSVFYADLTNEKRKGVKGVRERKRGGEIEKKGGGECKSGKERREGGEEEKQNIKGSRGGEKRASSTERKKHVGKCAYVQTLF
jgi:hypothetical protein